jgi:hypothetical protein
LRSGRHCALSIACWAGQLGAAGPFHAISHRCDCAAQSPIVGPPAQFRYDLGSQSICFSGYLLHGQRIFRIDGFAFELSALAIIRS